MLTLVLLVCSFAVNCVAALYFWRAYEAWKEDREVILQLEREIYFQDKLIVEFERELRNDNSISE